MRVLLDTNVVLDFVLERQPFFVEADEIFIKLQNNDFEGFVTAVTPINVFYTTRKEKGKHIAFQAIKELLKLVEITASSKLVFQNTLSLNFNDYEDAVQCVCAVAESLDTTVTRDTKDFAYSPIQIYSPTEFLKQILGDNFMKLHQLFFTILILFASFQICFGQKNLQARKVAEFGKTCSEQFESQLDNYLIELNNDPSAKGYVIFYGDENYEGRNLNYLDAPKSFIQFRYFDFSRIITLRGENQSEMKTQFWIVPAGVNPPKPEKDFIKSPIIRTTLYDKNWSDFNNDYNNRVGIYSNGFFELGCEFSPNRKGFAQEIKSNPELTGYLIIYTKFGKDKKHANRLGNFALPELINQYKVSRNRLKIIYGGNREAPEMEFWLVPKGSNPPIPTPDKIDEK